MADGQLGGLIYDNGVVQVVVLEAIVVIVHGLGGAKLLGLRELDGIVLQLLERGDVEIVKIIVGEVVHLSIDAWPVGGSGAMVCARGAEERVVSRDR